MTKPFVRDAAGHFRSLIVHSLREYEPTPEHILKRLLQPLCRDLERVLARGTARDAREALQLFNKECTRLR